MDGVSVNEGQGGQKACPVREGVAFGLVSTEKWECHLSLLKNIDYGIFEIAEEAGRLSAEVWKEKSVD